jgi:hypothetical protein
VKELAGIMFLVGIICFSVGVYPYLMNVRITTVQPEASTGISILVTPTPSPAPVGTPEYLVSTGPSEVIKVSGHDNTYRVKFNPVYGDLSLPKIPASYKATLEIQTYDFHAMGKIPIKDAEDKRKSEIVYHPMGSKFLKDVHPSWSVCDPPAFGLDRNLRLNAVYVQVNEDGTPMPIDENGNITVVSESSPLSWVMKLSSCSSQRKFYSGSYTFLLTIKKH